MVPELRADAVGTWLPLALADILSAWTGLDRVRILRGWGLDRMADRADSELLESFIGSFGATARKTGGQTK